MATPKPVIVSINALPYYLKRIHAFLESDKKSLSFPHISTQLKEVLQRIVTENTEFLHDGYQYDCNVLNEAAKLTAVLKDIKNVKLTYEFQNGNHGANVLMYKKIEVKATNALEPLRKPSEVLTASHIMPDPSATPIFKTRCLNVTTKFVKDDSQLVLKYPEMDAAQAEFVMNMLLPVIEGKTQTTELGYGYRSMYAPLWESMRVFGLKYRYKLDCMDCVGREHMKHLVFEKIPKFKVPENMDVDLPVTHNGSFSSTLSSITTNSTSSVSSTSNNPKRDKKKAAKIRKLLKELNKYMSKGNISKQFVQESLQRTSYFFMNEEEASILFPGMTHYQLYFLVNIECLSKEQKTYMLFSSECQKYLDNIKYCIQKNVQHKVVYKMGPKKMVRDVRFEKLAVFPNKAIEEVKNTDNNTSSKPAMNLTAPLSANLQERLTHLKAIKDAVVQTNGEKYITKTLEGIADFLTTRNEERTLVFEKVTQKQALFIKHVYCLSRTDEAYVLFSKKCQNYLFNIKSCAPYFKLQFVWKYDETEKKSDYINITISKKALTNLNTDENVVKLGSKCKISINQLYLACRQRLECRDKTVTKRSRSLSTGRRDKNKEEDKPKVHSARGTSGQRVRKGQAKLIEGLAQPVQSDKAVKIMQSMGWKGGALGLRGDGITEPIMPLMRSLDYLAKRAGFGHVPPKPNPPKPKPKKKAKKPVTLPTESIAVQRERELLPDGILPRDELPSDLLPPGILPPGCSMKTICIADMFHMSVLKAILELVSTDIEAVLLLYCAIRRKPTKIANFVKQAIVSFNKGKILGVEDKKQKAIMAEILKKYTYLTYSVSSESKKIIIKKATRKTMLKKLQEVMPKREQVITINTQNSLGVETTNTQELQVKTTVIQTPQVETTETQTPQVETTETQTPQVDTTENQTKQVETTETQIPLVETTETQIPLVETTETQKSLVEMTEILQMETAEAQTPRLETTETEVPQVETTATQKPQEVITTITKISEEMEATVTQIPKQLKTTKTWYVPNWLSGSLSSDENQQNKTTGNLKRQGLITKETQKQKVTKNKWQEFKTTMNQNLQEAVTSNGTQQNKGTSTHKPMALHSTNTYEPQSLSCIVVQKLTNALVNNNDIAKNYNTQAQNTKISPQITQNVSSNSNKNVPQIVDYVDLTGDFVISIGENSDGTSTVQNVNKKTVVADEENSIDSNENVEKASDKTKPLSQRIDDAVDALEIYFNESVRIEKDLDSPGKRPSPDLTNQSDSSVKKCKLLTDFKKLSVVPVCVKCDVPTVCKMDDEKARALQTAILKAIDYTKEKLPLLNCQGIQNGGLMYSCQDETSLFFMEDLIKRMDDFRIVYEFNDKVQLTHKMAFRMNSFIDERVDNILNRLQLYNCGLNTSNWVVIKKEQCRGFIVIYVDLDEGSFSYVCDANFVLYAGNDCAKFTIVWE